MLTGCVAADGLQIAGIPGEYSRPHDIRYFDGEVWRTTQVVDRITLSRTRRGDVAFRLNITAQNHHTCEMEGTAVRAGDSFEYRDHPDNAFDEGEPCLLRIATDGETAVIEDVGSHCRMVYCGARASIGRSEFQRDR